MGSIQVTPMTGSVGATVEGVDLNRLDDVVFAEIRKAFYDNCVIAIRGQSITPESLIAFGSRFGKLVMTLGTEPEYNQAQARDEILTSHGAHAEVLRVRNLGKAQSLTEHWHADNTHVPRPTAISILAAESLPAAGGDTMFSNQYLAYESLSPGMKRLLRGLRMRHSGANVPAFRGLPEDQIPFVFHPVVPTHAQTGRRFLFLGGRPSPGRRNFEHMTEEESVPLHRFLFEHSFQPHRVYRHRWQQGDVVMWDNRCTMHYAVHDYGDQPRDMNRVTVEGDAPVETPYVD